MFGCCQTPCAGFLAELLAMACARRPNVAPGPPLLAAPASKSASRQHEHASRHRSQTQHGRWVLSAPEAPEAPFPPFLLSHARRGCLKSTSHGRPHFSSPLPFLTCPPPPQPVVETRPSSLLFPLFSSRVAPYRSILCYVGGFLDVVFASDYRYRQKNYCRVVGRASPSQQRKKDRLESNLQNSLDSNAREESIASLRIQLNDSHLLNSHQPFRLFLPYLSVSHTTCRHGSYYHRSSPARASSPNRDLQHR